MVKKLKDNIGYITYIRGEMKKSFPDWHEMDAVYENQPNNNFQISFVKDLNKIHFTKDRGLLELSLYYDNNQIQLGYLIYNSINILSEIRKYQISRICDPMVRARACRSRQRWKYLAMEQKC